MQAKLAVRPFAFLGIGVLSAGAVFVIHRSLFSEPISTAPSTLASPEPVVEPQVDVRSDAAPELVPNAEGAGGSEEARIETATGNGPEEGGANAENPHIEALRHPSPVYRNVSLITVIRAAGHVCTEIVSATAGTDDFGTWRVSCGGARAYFVSEDGAGGLRVEPMAYLDEPVPRIEVQAPLETTPVPQSLERRLRLVPPPD